MKWIILYVECGNKKLIKAIIYTKMHLTSAPGHTPIYTFFQWLDHGEKWAIYTGIKLNTPKFGYRAVPENKKAK